MKRPLIVMALLSALLSAFWLVHAAPPVSPQADGPLVERGLFRAVDVYLDTDTTPLGAYQVEITRKDAALRARLVGLEGGESQAFRDAPYYDPVLLQPAAGAAGDGRIVVASFSTEERLPMGLTRVARLHFMVDGAAGVDLHNQLTARLVVATDNQGQAVAAKLALRPFQGDTQ